jgi:hypothetical protein
VLDAVTKKRGFVPIPEAVMGRLKQIHQPIFTKQGKLLLKTAIISNRVAILPR